MRGLHSYMWYTSCQSIKYYIIKNSRALIGLAIMVYMSHYTMLSKYGDSTRLLKIKNNLKRRQLFLFISYVS